MFPCSKGHLVRAYLDIISKTFQVLNLNGPLFLRCKNMCYGPVFALIFPLRKKNNSELLWCDVQRFLEKLLHFATTKTGRQRRRVEPEVSALFLLTPIVKTKSNCDEIMARGQMRTKERTSTVTNLLYPALLLVMRCEMCLRAWIQQFWGFLPTFKDAQNWYLPVW